MKNWRSFFTRPRLIAGVTLLALLLRLWAAWQLPVDFDEPVYLGAAYQYAELIHAGDWNGVIDFPESSEHPPLVKLLYAGGILALPAGAAWDDALFASRVISAVFGTLAVLLLALMDPLAGGLLAVQTLAVKYTSQAYLEGLPLFAAVAAVYLLQHSASPRDRYFWLSALALGLTAAGKFSYFPVLFILLYLAIWRKKRAWLDILAYLGLAAAIFWLFNPALWHEPANRLVNAIGFHVSYSQGAHVQEVDYPWYQPFLWISRSWGFSWHPEVFFYFGFDGLIFLFALGGIWLSWRNQRWLVFWALSGMLFLLLWPTKWPQYTLNLIPALCLLASPAMKFAYRKLAEQEVYWNWLEMVLPKPSRWFFIAGGILFLGLVAAGVAHNVDLLINRRGWSSLTSQTSGLPGNLVSDLLALPDGRMLAATDQGAAFWREAASADVVDEWDTLTPANSGLPDANVLALAQDRQGRLWFGTQRGLARLDGETWTSYKAQDMGLSGDQVNTLAVDGQDRLWVGTLSGAAVYDGQTWQTFTSQNSPLLDNSIFSIAVTSNVRDEKVWFGTLTGLASLDLHSGEWTSLSGGQADLGQGGVSDILVDDQGRLWVATLGGGISVWDGSSWMDYRVSNSPLPYNTVQEVAEAEPGSVWIGVSIPNFTGGLLSRLDADGWHTFSPNRSGYSGSEVLAVARDLRGRLWFGTRTSGIDIYDPGE